MKQKKVPPGTIIHEEKPFVHILNSKLRSERCDNCFEKRPLQKCSGCHYIHYCGRACQKESWEIHKKECANIKRVAPKVLPDAAHLLARLIIKLQNGGIHQKGYYTATSFRKFKDLMSHYSDIKEDKQRMEHLSSLYGVLMDYLHGVQIPNTAELIGIYGRMCINGFNILDPEMITIGSGIYLGASVIDHSCKPNAVAVFTGTTIHIRTLEMLPVLDWNQIFISYIDLLDTAEERKANLQCSYYFSCICPLCSDENQSSCMNSSICPKSTCNSMIDMSNEERDIKCEKCLENISDQFKTNYKSIIEFTNYQLKDMKNMAYLDLCKVCLRKQKGFLHPLNILHVKTLDHALEGSIQVSNWDYAEEVGTELLPGYRQYYGEIHPLRGLLLLKIGKIKLYKGKIVEALKYLKEAEKIIVITHGNKHSLYRESLMPLMYQATKEQSLLSESILIEQF